MPPLRTARRRCRSAEPFSPRPQNAEGRAQDTKGDNTSNIAGQITRKFDKRGDLVLVVGESAGEDPKPSRYLVCSKTLSRTCPAWATMLYGPFSERKPEDETIAWIVHLPEDKPDSLAIILSIIHGIFDVPSALALQSLFDLATLVDKYDLAHLLKPWAKGWLDGVKEYKKPGGEYILWIAWVLGEANLFSRVAQYVLLHAKVDDERGLVTDSNVPLESIVLSIPGLLDRVATARVEAVNRVYSPFLERISELVDPTTRHTLCRGKKSREHHLKSSDADMPAKLECCDYSLGLLVRLLSQHQLYPLSLDNRRFSIWHHFKEAKEIARQLKPTRQMLEPGTYYVVDHSFCGPERHLTSRIIEAVTSIPNFVTEEQKSHLNSQAKKTGLSTD